MHNNKHVNHACMHCILIMAIFMPVFCIKYLYCFCSSSINVHKSFILLLVFWYKIVGPLELYLGHEDETNRPNAVRS